VHWRLLEKGEFYEDKIILDEINEKNELIYESYPNEYNNLLLASKDPEAKKLTELKENQTEDIVYINSSFFCHDDIESELNDFNESEKINNENLLSEFLQTKNERNKDKKTQQIRLKQVKLLIYYFILLILEKTDDKFKMIIQKKRDLKDKIKNYLESIRVEYFILFSITVLFIKKFYM